jgi:hypothetical protein
MISRIADVPATPQEHFKLYFFGAVLRLRERLDAAPPTNHALERLDFLGGYFAELNRVGFGNGHDAAAWTRAVRSWERGVPGHLPLRALREAGGIDSTAIGLLFAIGLVEEDPRFGLVFDALQGNAGRHRPTVGLLTGWWAEEDEPGEVRAGLRRLLELGLCELVEADSPRSECALQVSSIVWDVLRGDAVRELGRWGRYRPPEELTSLDDLIAPETLLRSLRALPELLACDDVRTVIVRGPQAGGRKTMLGALAAATGRGVLEVATAGEPDAHWNVLGSLATLLRAVPVLELDLAPTETAPVARPPGLDGPLGIVLGRQGGLGGSASEASVTLTLGLPDGAARKLHWAAGLGPAVDADLDALASRFRMTGGNIRRTARLVRAAVALEGVGSVQPADVRRAARTLGRQALDTLAVLVSAEGDWDALAVDAETLEELRLLERRCRHREQLHATGAAAANAGVRALFSGPSGTGKTLAARLLASALHVDLYRLDLSTVVNKYIGETEKNLSRLLARAEELDVALVLDEGDALLTARTDVQTAHDRYANLETNYLLQRLETFEGVLVVTTNAADRIDPAFQRRMDVVIEFRAPDTAERWAIWHLHLPPEHDVDPQLLEEIAIRCALTGGQIQNAVVHATLLALGEGTLLNSDHIVAAVRREYRKSGGVCPLRPLRAEAYA